MQTEALLQDQQHEFTGITVRVISVSNVKSEIDGGQLFVKLRCHDKSAETKRKQNDRDLIVFDQHFFYNTTEILDDDLVFQLYETNQQFGSSKVLLSSKADKSKLNGVEGRLLGTTKPVQVSRLSRKNHEKTYQLVSESNKAIGKLTVGFDYLERQDIVGGIRCPNLSLRPEKNIRSPLTLQNKFAAYKNLYSFLDGNQTPNCEFFPKKFHH